MSEKKYKAVIYLRLSKEDGDKEESYSISNQRDLAMDFLSNHPEIECVGEMVDIIMQILIQSRGKIKKCAFAV